MAKLWLYGNSATDLAPQQQSWAGFYQGAAERDRAAAERANQINANLILQQQQADEAAMVRDQGQNINLWRYGVGDAAADRADLENTRRFDVGTSLDAQRIAAYGGVRREQAAERTIAEVKAAEQVAAKQEFKNLTGLFNSVSSGKVAGTPDELAVMFGVTPDKAAPVVAKASQQWAEKAADLLNQQTAKHQLAALATVRSDPTKRADPALTPQELSAIRMTVTGVPASVRYDPAGGKWTTSPMPRSAWDIEGDQVAALRARNAANPPPPFGQTDLTRYAPTATATTPPPPVRSPVIPQVAPPPVRATAPALARYADDNVVTPADWTSTNVAAQLFPKPYDPPPQPLNYDAPSEVYQELFREQEAAEAAEIQRKLDDNPVRWTPPPYTPQRQRPAKFDYKGPWPRPTPRTGSPNRVDLSRFNTATERPAVPLGNGSVGTVLSIGVGDERGEWVIPTIVNGRVLPQDEAIQLWRDGRNPPLAGPFKTPQEATAFAEQFHKQEENRLFGNRTARPANTNAPMRVGRFKIIRQE